MYYRVTAWMLQAGVKVTGKAFELAVISSYKGNKPIKSYHQCCI